MIRSRRIAGLALLMCLAAIAAAGAAWIIGPQPLGRIEIFPGVSFRSDILPVTEEGGGRVYVVVADLRAPGLQLYVTPLDPAALAKGFRYRLRRISEVTRTEQLSVVVNGAMFDSQSPFWFRLPGDLANSAFGTLVADHVVADVQHTATCSGLMTSCNPICGRGTPRCVREIWPRQSGRSAAKSFCRTDRLRA